MKRLIAILAMMGALIGVAGISPAQGTSYKPAVSAGVPSTNIAPYVNKCVNYYKPNSTHVDSNVIARVCANMTRNSAGESFFLGLGLETTWAPPGGNFTGNVSTLVDFPEDSGVFSCYATIGDGATYNDCGGITWTINKTAQITIDTAAYGPACVYATYSAIEITQNTGCPGNG